MGFIKRNLHVQKYHQENENTTLRMRKLSAISIYDLHPEFNKFLVVFLYEKKSEFPIQNTHEWTLNAMILSTINHLGSKNQCHNELLRNTHQKE